MIKGIIFDYGGTLDTEARHWSEVLWEGYQASGVPVTKEQFLTAYVYAERELARIPHILPTDTFYDLLYKKVGLEFDNLCQQGVEFSVQQRETYALEIAKYCDTVARNQVKQNIAILEELSKTYPMVLVTNFYGNIHSVIKEYRIDAYFTDVVESAVVGVRKPSPQIFTLGVEALKLQPHEVVVIGDSYSKDIQPALEAGCKAVWLKGESWQGKEEKIEYNRTIYTLIELLQIIKEI
jgi:putative hydrolase of the HAD superfamily